MKAQSILIAGGSGFIGTALAREFSARGHSVVVLSRSPRRRTDGVLEMEWDGASPGAWTAKIDGAHAVINLAGKGINCLHTPENLREIMASRVNSVNALAAAVARAQVPPSVWVQASAVGFYGDTGDTARVEGDGAGADALAKVCEQWEGAFASAKVPGTRKVTLRIGFVLGREGGALPILSRLTRWFLGGAAGSGRQYLSWIHLADLAAIFNVAVEQEKFSGVFNAVAPNAVTNAQFMRELRRSLRRPWSPPVPALAVKIGARLMGSEGALALMSQRCVPQRFEEAGFQFQFGGLSEALDDLLRP